MKMEQIEVETFKAELKEMIKSWCELQPGKGCTNSCYNIKTCQNTKTCESLKATGTVTNYDTLVSPDHNKFFPQADYLRKFIGGNIDPKKITEPLKNLSEYLKEYIKNPCRDNEKLNKAKNNFDDFYTKWNLPEALAEIKNGIVDFPFHPEIVRRWALIHNRLKLNGTLRTALEEKIQSDNLEVKLECYLGLFENYLNGHMVKIHNPDSFKHLEAAKEKYLDKIPDIQNDNGQYHYFLARFFEVQWLISSQKTKSVISPILREALDSINISIRKYEEEKNSTSKKDKYPGEEIPYWLYGHKCILLKLLGHKEFENQREHYGQIMEEKLINGLEQKSVQIYSVTYFLLRDKEEELNSFFNKLNKEIKKTEQRSVVDNFTFHHVDLIYHDNEEKRNGYIKLLDDWFNANTNA